MIAFISRTALSQPAKIECATIACPMFSSTMPGKRRDRLHVRVMQTVARVHLEPERVAEIDARRDALELALLFGFVVRFGISARVQFDHRRAGFVRGANLRLVRIDEQRLRATPASASCRHAAFTSSKRPATSRPPSVVTSSRFSGTRQTSCGLTSHAMSSISCVTAHSRFMRVFRSGRSVRTSASTIWRRSSRRVQRDDVGARFLGGERGADRIGIRRAARIAQRGNVIDVHAQIDHARWR